MGGDFVHAGAPLR
ncbi:hypothetical protein A2U01_0116975, partial [Trifolium medium]|nr:hypothetical protein [Trifolium medium]